VQVPGASVCDCVCAGVRGVVENAREVLQVRSGDRGEQPGCERGCGGRGEGGIAEKGDDMGIKMTLAEKWDDRWFRRLDPMEKLAFLYLCDRCDCAGFLEVDIEKFAFETRVSESDWIEILGLEGSGKGLEGSGKGLEGSRLSEKVVLHGRWVWVKNHIRHQKNLPLSSKNSMHKGIVQRLADHSDIKEVADFMDTHVANLTDFCRPHPDPTMTLERVTGKGKGKGKGNGKGGDCKEGDDLTDGTGGSNEVYQKIRRHPNVVGLSYEQYLTVLKDYDITERDVARNIEWLMGKVVLFGEIAKPALWLAKRFSEIERGENGAKNAKKNKGAKKLATPIDGWGGAK